MRDRIVEFSVGTPVAVTAAHMGYWVDDWNEEYNEWIIADIDHDSYELRPIHPEMLSLLRDWHGNGRENGLHWCNRSDFTFITIEVQRPVMTVDDDLFEI